MASKTSGSPLAGCVIVLVVLAVIVGAIINAFHGGTSTSDTTDTPDYSTYVPDLPTDSTDDSTDGSGGDGSVNLPGGGYVSGPGVNCGFGGCHAHILPRIGIHF